MKISLCLRVYPGDLNLTLKTDRYAKRRVHGDSTQQRDALPRVNRGRGGFTIAVGHCLLGPHPVGSSLSEVLMGLFLISISGCSRLHRSSVGSWEHQ